MDKKIENSMNINSQNQFVNSNSNKINNINQNSNFNNVSLLPNSEDQLNSIRNIISFVEKEADLFSRPDKHHEIIDEKLEMKPK